MLMRSLTMMRMYQPLTNSSLSQQGASLPLLFLQYSLYSCSQHQETPLSSCYRPFGLFSFQSYYYYYSFSFVL